MGTRFIATPEARSVHGYKDTLLATKEDGTVVTRAYTGKTCRVVANDYTRSYADGGRETQPFPAQFVVSLQDGANHMGGDESTPDVDPAIEFFPAGQGVGAIHDLVPAADLVHQFVADAEKVLSSLSH